jgi:hypothetical protein
MDERQGDISHGVLSTKLVAVVNPHDQRLWMGFPIVEKYRQGLGSGTPKRLATSTTEKSPGGS